MTTFSPEQQLRHLAKILMDATERKRDWNGKGRSSVYVERVDTIAQTGRQFAEMVVKYLNGELEPSVDDGFPF